MQKSSPLLKQGAPTRLGVEGSKAGAKALTILAILYGTTEVVP